MIRAKIANLIDLAIEAGSNSAADLSDAFTALHESLEAEGKEGTLRHFFDCWSDALNHNFGVYKTKNPSELEHAARELKYWYKNEIDVLSKRELWNEALPKNLNKHVNESIVR